MAVPALAQAPVTEPERMEKTIVTGSNIPTAETVAIAPVDVLTSETLSKVGVAEFENLAKRLPSTIGAGNFGMSRATVVTAARRSPCAASRAAPCC